MSSPMCDIAFVTVNYNTRALVADMLAFFGRSSLPFSHTLVVVDNGSTDGSHELLSEVREGVLYIPAGENLGYGRAINRGIRAVRSRYVCVLNTDIAMSAECLTRLWEFMERTPAAGVVAPRITNRDGSTQGFIFQHSTLAMFSGLANRISTSLLKRELARATGPMQVDGVLGAFFLIRYELTAEGRLFDEDFFFYFEDTELAHRLHAAGVNCYVLPDCSIIHFGGGSTSIEAARMFFRSKHLYVTKCYGNRCAEAVKQLDRIRLRMKYLKYAVLALLLPTGKVAAKKKHYALMRHAGDF